MSFQFLPVVTAQLPSPPPPLFPIPFNCSQAFSWLLSLIVLPLCCSHHSSSVSRQLGLRRTLLWHNFITKQPGESREVEREEEGCWGGRDGRDTQQCCYKAVFLLCLHLISLLLSFTNREVVCHYMGRHSPSPGYHNNKNISPML